MNNTDFRTGKGSAWLSTNHYDSRYSQTRIGSVYRNLPPYMPRIHRHHEPKGLLVARVAFYVVLIALVLEVQWFVLTKLM